MLAKILKGSKDKRVLELGLDKSPVYGFFSKLTIDEITARIDWLIVNDYLKISYDHKLPLLTYTAKGWDIERDIYSEELLDKLKESFDTCDYSFVLDLKDRNRGMILQLLSKIKFTRDKRFIPLLEAWAAVDYKKVQLAIAEVIEALDKQRPFTVLPGDRDNIT